MHHEAHPKKTQPADPGDLLFNPAFKEADDGGLVADTLLIHSALNAFSATLARDLNERLGKDIAAWYFLDWLKRRLWASRARIADDIRKGRLSADARDLDDAWGRCFYRPFRQMAEAAYSHAAWPVRREIGEPPALCDPQEGVKRLDDWLCEATQAAWEQVRQDVKDTTLLQVARQRKQSRAPEVKKARKRRTKDEVLCLGAQAAVLAAEHPDWTQSQIAKELDISRSHLSTLPVFKRAWKQRKGAKTDYSRKHTVRDRQGRYRPRI